MFQRWIICMLLVCALGSKSAVDRLKEQNKQLTKANSVLLQALKEMNAEMQVGENAAVVGSERMVGLTGGQYEPIGSYSWQGYGCVDEVKKSCTGNLFNLNWFNRETQSKPAHSKNYNGWCLRQCMYLAAEGCCQYDLDTDKCWFSFDGTVEDNDYSKKYMTTELGYEASKYEYVYQRYGGMCRWSGSKIIVDYNRKSGCDWNGDDKIGQRQMSGSNNSDVDCTAFCMDNPTCIFAQIKDGVCRTFQTCHSDRSLNDYGYRMWQKVEESAPYDYYNGAD